MKKKYTIMKPEKQKTDTEILNDIERKIERGRATDREIRLWQEARVVFR